MISNLLQRLRTKELTATALVEQYLKKIEHSNLDAWVTVCAESALSGAKKRDASGDFSEPLAGIPVGIKDILCTKGVRTTAGSKILETFVPPYSATAVEKLESAGAIVLGKTNCDEFAMGSSTENSAFLTTKNPHDTTRVPGGSSGGSAAAVAGDECAAALGTDTGGSIRQPANFCGCVGLKVTYGRVSRFGAISYASSFDTVGPMTRSVADAAILLETLAGTDPRDATTPNKTIEKYSECLDASLSGKTIALPKEFLNAEGLDPEVKNETLRAAKILESAGAKIVEISLPLTKYAIPTYYLLTMAEASTNLARYDGVRYGEKIDGKNLEDLYKNTRGELFGDEPKRKIILGTFALSAGYADKFYEKAAEVRTLFAREYAEALEKADAILAPVSPFPAFPIGEKKDDPLQMYLADIFTVSVNLAGIPALAVPTGRIEKLPSGVQILGKQWNEAGILNIGSWLEKGAGYNA